MTSAAVIDLKPEYGSVVGAGDASRPAWLIDNLVAAEGLTTITGASKTGKTTLAIDLIGALRDRKRRFILDSSIERNAPRVLVIGTHGQHVQYAEAFGDAGDEVAVIETAPLPPSGFWSAYADAAKSFAADLTVIDAVHSLAGAATPENLAGLCSFPCPVIGVFVGWTGTPTIKDGDDYRSLAISSVWVKQDSKNGTVTANVSSRWSADRVVPYDPETARTNARRRPATVGLTGDALRAPLRRDFPEEEPPF